MTLFGKTDALTGFKAPDITPIQVVTIAGAILAVVVDLGWGIDTNTRNDILVLIGAVAALLLGSDAVIRNGRSQIAAARVQSEAIKTSSLGPAMDFPITAPGPDRDDTELPQRSPIVPS